MPKADKQIKCECGETFTLLAGEQDFYEKKGLKEPKRCKPCRDRRRAATASRERQEGSPFHPKNWGGDKTIDQVIAEL